MDKFIDNILKTLVGGFVIALVCIAIYAIWSLVCWVNWTKAFTVAWWCWACVVIVAVAYGVGSFVCGFRK